MKDVYRWVRFLGAMGCGLAWSFVAWGGGDLFKEGMFRVSVRGVLEYDDNVYGSSDSSNKEGAWRAIVKVRGSANVSTESLYGSLVYEPAYTWYLNLSEDDFVNDLNALARYNMSERLKIALKNHLLENQVDVVEVLDLRDSNDQYFYDRLMADFTYYLTPKLNTNLALGIDYMTYETFVGCYCDEDDQLSSFRGGSQLDFERWAYDAFLGETWRMSKRVSIVGSYQIRDVEYVIPEGKTLLTHHGVLGGSWRITEKTSIDGRGGVNVADSGGETQWGPTANAGVTSRLTRSTNAKVGFSYSFAETERTYSVTTRGSVMGMLEHNFTRKMSAYTILSYKTFDYRAEDDLTGQGVDGSERWLDFNITVRHALIYKYLSVFGYYALTNVESDFGDEGYWRNRIGLGVVGNF